MRAYAECNDNSFIIMMIIIMQISLQHLFIVHSMQHKHTIKLIIFNRPEFQYSCGRESQIWKVTKAAAIAYPTERTIQLAKHKTNPPGFQPFFMLNCGRSSPIWRPSTAAMSAKLRPRTAQLAMPKPFHQNYLPPRQVRGKENL